MKVSWSNILAVGDLHLRRSAPAARCDDFLAAQERKLQEIFAIALENDCGAVIFPGDVFDRSDSPHGLVEWAIRQFSGHDLLYLFVFGQHDLRYHTSDKQNTPLGVLCAALGDKARMLSPESPFCLSMPKAELAFWGCSWGEPLPASLPPKTTNIIVLHRPVTIDSLPWEHEDLITAKQLVKECPASLFISGDNHTQFCADFRRASVVNLGSVMRLTTAQTDHKPAVAVFSFAEHGYSYELLPLTIRRGIFDTQAIEESKANEERMQAFISSLQGEFDPELRFVDNLRLAAEQSSPGVQAIIEEVMR